MDFHDYAEDDWLGETEPHVVECAKAQPVGELPVVHVVLTRPFVKSWPHRLARVRFFHPLIAAPPLVSA